jgi:hypothetical protein
MAITTLVVLSSVATQPEGWDQLGQWTGSIQLVGGVPWAYAHVLRVQAPPWATPAPSQRLDAEQRRRLFSATWTCATEEQVRADLNLLFGSPVVVEDPRDAAVLREQARRGQLAAGFFGTARESMADALQELHTRSTLNVRRVGCLVVELKMLQKDLGVRPQSASVNDHLAVLGRGLGQVYDSLEGMETLCAGGEPTTRTTAPAAPPAEGAQSEEPVALVGHVRQALERALTFAGDSKALDRLPEHERTVDGLARAYLPNLLWLDYDGTRMHEDTLAALRSTRWRHPLYVYERSMAHALLVLIALASGHDPGLYGLSVQLDRVDDPGDNEEKIACAGWFLYTPTGGLDWFDDDEDDQAACTIAAELDPVRASVLALLHVLAAKAGEAEATS